MKTYWIFVLVVLIYKDYIAQGGKRMKEYFAKLKYLFRWRDVAFAVFLLGITVLFAFCSSENMMDVTFGDEAVDIVTDKYTMNIRYGLYRHQRCPEADGRKGV